MRIPRRASTGCSPRGATSTTTAACTPKPGPPRPSATTPRAATGRPHRTRRCCAGRLQREQRKVTAFATVSLHGNRYEVDAALVGRTVDLLFTLFDLTVIDVEYNPSHGHRSSRTTSAGMSTPRSNPTTPP